LSRLEASSRSICLCQSAGTELAEIWDLFGRFLIASTSWESEFIAAASSGLLAFNQSIFCFKEEVLSKRIAVFFLDFSSARLVTFLKFSKSAFQS
jgi:hypothetical protein